MILITIIGKRIKKTCIDTRHDAERILEIFKKGYVQILGVQDSALSKSKNQMVHYAMVRITSLSTMTLAKIRDRFLTDLKT